MVIRRPPQTAFSPLYAGEDPALNEERYRAAVEQALALLGENDAALQRWQSEADATYLRLDADNSPVTGRLTLQGGTAPLTLENPTSFQAVALQMRVSDDTSSCFVYFGSTAGNNIAHIRYNHSDVDMICRINGTESDGTPGRFRWVKAGVGTPYSGASEIAAMDYEAGTDLPTDTSVVTRERGDARYLLYDDILGTVSESGGTPTGSVIERGSNSDGSYVRFADGTQICTQQLAIDELAVTTASGALYYTSIGPYPFPAAFVGGNADYIAFQIGASGNSTIRNSTWAGRYRRDSSTNTRDWTGLQIWSTISVTASPGEITHITLFAYGRWF